MKSKPVSSNPVSIDWCTEPSNIEALVELFVANARNSYISHSELQGRRAESTTRWRSDLAVTLRDEFLAIFAQDPSIADTLIAVANIDGKIAGMALVSLEKAQRAHVPFATLDDLMVHPDHRGKGLGHQLFEWIEREMLERGIQRLFLESGKGNHSAHRFFETQGFQAISVVMMKELGGA